MVGAGAASGFVALHDGAAAVGPQQVQQIVMREYSRLHQSERSLIFFISNMARLTPAERELVRLLLQGLKVQEIAAALDMNESTVKTKLRRGRFKLKELLTKEALA